MYFIGWSAFSIAIPSYADRNGRKIVILCSFVVASVATFLILVSSSIYMLLINSLLLGMTAPGRVTVAFVYMQEFVMPQWRVFVGSLSSLLFITFSAIVIIYLRYIAPYSSHLIAVAVLLGVTSSALVFYKLDESAIFLLKTG